MARWKAGTALLALCLLAGSAWADAPQPFQKLPTDNPAYRAIQQLERAGYFTGAPGGTFNGRSLRTRYEFAVAVERVFRSFQPRVLAANEPASLLQDLQVFKPLLRQFSEDIGALGPDVNELEQQLDAMQERLRRLLQDPLPGAASIPEPAPEPMKAPVIPPVLSDSPLSFGIRSKLRQSLVANWLAKQGAGSGSDLTRSPFGPSLKPGLVALLGPALVGFEVEENDALISDVGMPLADAGNQRNVRAHLSLPIGSYVASAWYNRLGGNWDPFGQWNTFSGGPAEDFGAQFSGSFTSRLGFQFQGGSLRGLVDDPVRVGYMKTSLNYDFGRFHLNAGYERFHQSGVLGGVSSAYYLGLSRSFGRAELNALLRNGDNSSALTQFTIRF